MNIDLFPAALRRGDQLLLCTDGLTNMSADESIRQIVTQSPSTREACSVLLNTALVRGGRDNITMVLARVANSDIEPDDNSR